MKGLPARHLAKRCHARAAVDDLTVHGGQVVLGIGVPIADHDARETPELRHHACIVSAGVIVSEGRRDPILERSREP